MNYADFFTATNGFPLEADATLGFMQSDYQTALRGLAGLVGTDNYIVSGCIDTGSNVSDGWIWYGGDLVRFQGGAKQANFVLVEDTEQKNNQDGTPYDRYTTKYAQFGSGTGSVAFDTLKRLDGIAFLRERLLDMLSLENEVIMSGMNVTGITVSNCSISAGVVLMARKFISAPAYSGVYPVYFTDAGTWTNTVPPAGDYIKFDPHPSQRLRDVVGRAASPIGDVKMRVLLNDRFDNTGLGRWEMQGWALMNGANGTFDIRSRFPVSYDNRISSPGGNFYDAAYNTPGNIGGERLHTLTIPEMPSHTHTFTNNANSTANSGKVAVGGDAPEGSPPVSDATGGGQPHENRPPYLVLVFIQRIS